MDCWEPSAKTDIQPRSAHGVGMAKPLSIPTNVSEADLIAAARRRDEVAMRTLVQQHNRRLFRIARSILRDDDDAEDAVQEAYVKAFTKLADFRGESAFGTWLCRI